MHTEAKKELLKLRFLSVWFFVFIAISLPSVASEMPTKLQATLIAKILNYERNLANRLHEEEVSVGVVFDPRDAESAQRADELGGSLSKVFGAGALKAGTLAVEVVPYDKPADLERMIESKKIGVLVVGAELTGAASDIADSAKKLSVVTFGTSFESLKKGLAIGVFVENNKPKIVVNLKASKAQGADLSSALLKLATVLR